VASLIRTAGDYQGMAPQVAKLEAIGCVVMPSNHQAAMLAAAIIKKAEAR
jgi:hypothetical protein